jgi:hypothetical protein
VGRFASWSQRRRWAGVRPATGPKASVQRRQSGAILASQSMSDNRLGCGLGCSSAPCKAVQREPVTNLGPC